MQRTGIASLPLHGGKAPQWLTVRMRKLAREISSIIIAEYGKSMFLTRLSDPYWFQALGCVLGYDWHSSGLTTVVTGVLKTALSAQEHGVVVCGGKGKTSRNTPKDIQEAAEKFEFSEDQIQSLIHTSKITAKVDNAAVQAGYKLYHHTMFITEDAKWAVVQQGMSVADRTARRYHWLSDSTTDFVVEPHTAIVGDIKRLRALNMIAKASEACRKTSVDLAKETTKKLMNLVQNVLPPPQPHQKSLQEWLPRYSWGKKITFLNMPREINWKALCEAYETQPVNYEELLSIKGVGPATIRGLALVAELIYGEKPSWNDPVKYSFAYGGKDGVPYPVNRNAMDQSIYILKEAAQTAKIGNKEKTRALQGLRQFAPLDT